MQPDLPHLPERSLILFKALVEHFIQDGQPVGSRTLARDTGLDLSPATIRNVMADLEDMGLLESPHTSAGRVPTVKGYRLFVDTLLRVDRPDEAEIRRIARELGQADSVQALMERTSSLISEITRLVGIVMLPRAPQQSWRQIEFISMTDNRVLVILVINEREVQNRIIRTARKYSQSELRQAANFLNSTYAGRDLQSVRSDLLRDLRSMKEHVNEMMQSAIEMAQTVFECGSAEAGGDFVVSGQTNLMEIADLCDLDKLRRLFESFNRKRDILHLLEQSINASGVQIFIGEESGYEVLENCSVVTSPYESEGEILGVLGVIGPTRMNYERVIPIVDVTAKMLGSALNSRN
jgi:heat-inducible transcriptional repressor